MKTELVFVTCVLLFTLGNTYLIRKYRNALPPNSGRKWDKYQDKDGRYVIPYVIGANYSAEDHKHILQLMDKIAANTCVKFRKRNNEEDYVAIVNGLGDGCNSAVGRPGGKSTMFLESSKLASCITPRTAMRFLLHAVGLFGEQMREDRDNFIRVHRENIQEGYEYSFTKVLSGDASTYGVPYDYLSIMHSPKDAYAKPGTVTIETLDPAYQDMIGKVNEPSVHDYSKVCLMYKCKICMGEKTPP